MRTENLLIELGTEELPPKQLRKLAQAFADNFAEELTKLALPYQELKWYASPRRLALHVEALAFAQQDKTVEKRGPAVRAAFDAAGQATKAALGWAASNGITIEQAQRLETDKGAWLVHHATVAGQDVFALIPDAVNSALARLPIAKPMRWGSSSVQFIRPVHTLTMLYGSDLIAGEVLGVNSAKQLQGHRFHHSGMVSIVHADEYLALLAGAKVIADHEQRKAMVKQQVIDAGQQAGGVAIIDEDLLEEVTSLVEWPVALVGQFEEKFLAVPAEALMVTMKDNQKYFPVFDSNGQLLPKFVFVTNIESKDPSQVISGNEKVVRPRLADAEFFFNTDKKHRLESRLQSLATVLFQQQLGTLKEKSERIAALAGFIAEQLGADKAQAERAGLLSKADLMTEMVQEFPEIQGVMGMYYARLDGESEAVAVALNEQYQPRFAGDQLPNNAISCAVALADKFDTLVGIFGIGQAPKGDKDPFALRRAAIGALRIIAEKQYPLDIEQIATYAAQLFADKLSNPNVVNDVTEFMLARFRAAYQEQGIAVDVIQAVLARRPTKPFDFEQRVKAVSYFRDLEQAEALAAANKRVANILAKNTLSLADVNSALLQEPAEQALQQKVAGLTVILTPMFARGEYQAALGHLAELKDSVDAFFDNVMVNADDEAIRVNRLSLLSQLQQLFLQVADISLLQK